MPVPYPLVRWPSEFIYTIDKKLEMFEFIFEFVEVEFFTSRSGQVLH